MKAGIEPPISSWLRILVSMDWSYTLLVFSLIQEILLLTTYLESKNDSSDNFEVRISVPVTITKSNFTQQQADCSIKLFFFCAFLAV